jgi:hypothetical protein
MDLKHAGPVRSFAVLSAFFSVKKSYTPQFLPPAGLKNKSAGLLKARAQIRLVKF